MFPWVGDMVGRFMTGEGNRPPLGNGLEAEVCRFGIGDGAKGLWLGG